MRSNQKRLLWRSRRDEGERKRNNKSRATKKHNKSSSHQINGPLRHVLRLANIWRNNLDCAAISSLFIVLLSSFVVVAISHFHFVFLSTSSRPRAKDSIIYDAKEIAKYRTFVYHRTRLRLRRLAMISPRGFYKNKMRVISLMEHVLWMVKASASSRWMWRLKCSVLRKLIPREFACREHVRFQLICVSRVGSSYECLTLIDQIRRRAMIGELKSFKPSALCVRRFYASECALWAPPHMIIFRGFNKLQTMRIERAKFMIPAVKYSHCLLSRARILLAMQGWRCIKLLHSRPARDGNWVE